MTGSLSTRSRTSAVAVPHGPQQSPRILIASMSSSVEAMPASFSGTWSNWTSISGDTSVQAEPAAVSWGPNRIDVFAWGADFSLLHDGDSWTLAEGFEKLGQGLSGPPKAVSGGVGSLHVFSYSHYGELDHKAWSDSRNMDTEQWI
jgi:hypothetical protein